VERTFIRYEWEEQSKDRPPCSRPHHAPSRLLALLQDERRKIDWSLRLRIAKDIAKGVAFLHRCSPPILHHDLKSPNVLVQPSTGTVVTAAAALMIMMATFAAGFSWG